MKNKFLMSMLLAASFTFAKAELEVVKTYDFTSYSEETVSNLAADTQHWVADGDNNGHPTRYKNVIAMPGILTANDVVISELECLSLPSISGGNISIRHNWTTSSGLGLQIGSSNLIVGLPTVKNGQIVEITFISGKSTEDRGVSAITGLSTELTLPFQTKTEEVTFVAEVTDETNATFKYDGGLILKSLVIKEESSPVVIEKTAAPAITSEDTAEGTFVTIATETEGASIYYTIDGTTPTEESSLYVEPFKLDENATVTAIAMKENFKNSDITSEFIAVVNLSGKKTMAYLHNSTYGTKIFATDTDPLLPLLEEIYHVTVIDVNTLTAKDIDIVKGYDIIYVTEAIGGTHAFGLALKELVGVVPMVNTKAFFYNLSARWDWATPQNPSSKTGTMVLTAEGMAHKLFAGIEYDAETGECVVFDNTDQKNQLQAWSAAEGNFIYNDVVLSTAGDYNCVHEHVTEGSEVKYVLLPFSTDDFINVNSNGLKLIINACEYVCPTSDDDVPVIIPEKAEAPAIASTDNTDGTYVSIISATEDASIYYTLDESEPTVEAGILYEGFFKLEESATVKAIAVKEGFRNSDVSSEYITVINLSGKKSLAFIYDSSYGAHTAYFEESSLLLPLLEERYEVTKVDVNGKTAADLNIVKDFDMLFVTEALKGTHAFGVALKDMVGVIPMVNTKAYFYTVSGRWGWAAPQNPNPATGVMTLTAEGMVHPLFDGVIFNEGTGECVLFDNTTSKNQLQSWTASEGNVIYNDVVLSTAGDYNCVHEHVTEGSDVKYVLLPFSSDDFANISENGVKLLLNGCEYVCPSEFTGEDFTPTKVETTSVAKAIVSVEYYNISGMKTPAPVQGINIVKTTFEDGSVEATKVIIK